MEVATHLFEGLDLAVGEAEAHDQHLSLPLVEAFEHERQVLLEELERSNLYRDLRIGVLNEVAKGGVVLLPERGLERDRILGDPAQLGDLLRPDPRWGAALVFYALFVAGVVLFVTLPAPIVETS